MTVAERLLDDPLSCLGQTVMLDPLPLDSEEQPIDIEPTKPRVLRAEDRTTDAIAETAKSTEQTAPAIVVPIAKERPSKPHPLIAKWIADRERRRREATASRDPWRIKMAPAAVGYTTCGYKAPVMSVLAKPPPT